MNPLFQMMNAGGPNMGNLNQFRQAFENFKQQFRGDPREQIQRMMQSGQISQEQYNAAVQKAQQIMQILKG